MQKKEIVFYSSYFAIILRGKSSDHEHAERYTGKSPLSQTNLHDCVRFSMSLENVSFFFFLKRLTFVYRHT